MNRAPRLLATMCLLTLSGVAFAADPSADTWVTKLLQTSMDALAVGSLYALIALGYTMVYGILRFINFAHSDIFMLGAWVSWTIAAALGWAAPGAPPPPLWAGPFVIVAVMAICGLIGFTIERLAYRPLRASPRINVLITAIGVSLFLENVGQLPFVFGTQPQRMPALFEDAELAHVAGVTVHLVDVLVIGIALALMLALEWVIFRTKLGLGMRAVSYDTRVAALMGVPVDRVISITFVIGSSLAAAAGFLAAMKYPGLNQPAHSTWVLLGLKAFVAAVIGGIGNVRGAMAGGLLIGLVELFGAAYFSPHLRDVYVFSLLILVLLFKPSGLLGTATVEKV
jgi:branched-chain amino acid transport system permease protein